MSGETARLRLAELPEGQAMNAAEINTVLGQLDALVDCCLKGVFVDASPATASDGDVYLVGGSPSGDWGAEFTYKLACRRDGAWVPVIPFDGLRAFVPAADTFLVYAAGVWTDWNALIGAAEGSIASAATCDIGAAGSLFLQVTGTTTITGFGAAANRLRFLRFAGALTLTHNGACLVLPGGANIATAAGDTAIFRSDGATPPVWRCLGYTRSGCVPYTSVSPGFSGTMAVVNAAFTGATTHVNTTVRSHDAITALTVNVASNTAPTATSAWDQQLGSTTGSMTKLLASYNAGNAGPVFAFHKSFGGAPGSFGAIGGTANLATLSFSGDDGVTAGGVVGGYIQVTADGVGWGTGASTTRMSFVTGKNGTLTEALRLDSNANVTPGTDNAKTLGSSSLRWSVVYAGTGAINTSGAAAKANVRAFGDAELAVARALAADARLYQFCDAIAAKGVDAARLHTGMIFEDVVAAFQAQGLEPRRYGIVCEDPAFKAVAATAPDGEAVTMTVPDLDANGQQKTVLGLRYDELAQFVLAGLAARVASLEARLAAG